MNSQPTPVPERSSTGIEANLAGALCYLVWFISGIAILAIEKESTFVKFHALQSTLLFLPTFVVISVLLSIPLVGWVLAYLLWIASLVLWLVLMFKAYSGERVKLPYIGRIAEEHARP